MSIQKSINEQIAEDIGNVVYNHVCLNQQIHNNRVASVKKVVFEQVFGNIAFYQASDSTIFPNVEKSMPEINFPEVPGNVEGEILIPAHRLQLRFNISVVVNVIKTHILLSSNALIRGLTFRQACAPFASDARSFLLTIYQLEGLVSTLGMTLPKMCEKAPWVAFDFNRGLNFKSLTSAERSVMQNLQRRLLATQGKIDIISAQIDGASSDVTA